MSEFDQLQIWRTVKIVKNVAKRKGYYGDPLELIPWPMGTHLEELAIVNICVDARRRIGHRQHDQLVNQLTRRCVLGHPERKNPDDLGGQYRGIEWSDHERNGDPCHE